MWRSEDGDFFFRRVRSNVNIKRLLPGPWSIELGYTRQINFNNPSNFNIITTGVSYEWKKKTKPKKNPINPLKVSPSIINRSSTECRKPRVKFFETESGLDKVVCWFE